MLTRGQIEGLARIVRTGLLRSYGGQLVAATEDDPARALCVSVCRKLLESNSDVSGLARVDWRVHLVQNDDVALTLALPVSEVFRHPLRTSSSFLFGLLL